MLSQVNHREQKGTTTSGKQTRLVVYYSCLWLRVSTICEELFCSKQGLLMGSYVCDIHHNDQCSTTVYYIELLY